MAADEFYAAKVVWVVGAGSGIGRAVAIELARRGSLLILSDREISELEKVQDECRMMWNDPGEAINLVQV